MNDFERLKRLTEIEIRLSEINIQKANKLLKPKAMSEPIFKYQEFGKGGKVIEKLSGTFSQWMTELNALIRSEIPDEPAKKLKELKMYYDQCHLPSEALQELKRNVNIVKAA